MTDIPKLTQENEPVALQSELRLIYQNMPMRRSLRPFGTGNEEDMRFNASIIWDTVQNRTNSVHKRILEQQLKNLLAQSPTTQSFQDFIALFFDEVYVPGKADPATQRRSPNESIFAEVLNLDDPTSFGIFDPLTAKRKEMDHYGIMQQRLIDYTVIEVEMDEVPGERRFGDLQDITFLRERLSIWRSEFLTLHGVEIFSR